MKKICILGLIPFLMWACGDDKSSSPSDSSNDSSKVFSGNFFNGSSGDSNDSEAMSTSYNHGFSVNDSLHRVTIHEENYVGFCSVDRTDSAMTWVSADPDVRDLIYAYEFIDDALVLYNYNSEGDFVYFSSDLVLLGGKAGSFDGEWEVTPCNYDPTDLFQCLEWEDGSSRVIYTFSGNSVQVKVVEHDFSQTEMLYSKYTAGVMNTLLDERNRLEVYPYDITVLSKRCAEEFFDRNDIRILSHDKGTFSFAIKDEVFEMKYSDVRFLDDVVITDRDKYNRSFKITVSNKSDTCFLDYAYQTMTESLCNESNLHSVGQFYTTNYTVNGTKQEFFTARSFEKSNEDEFRSCLSKIALKSEIVDAPNMSVGASGEDSY